MAFEENRARPSPRKLAWRRSRLEVKTVTKTVWGLRGVSRGVEKRVKGAGRRVKKRSPFTLYPSLFREGVSAPPLETSFRAHRHAHRNRSSLPPVQLRPHG